MLAATAAAAAAAYSDVATPKAAATAATAATAGEQTPGQGLKSASPHRAQQGRPISCREQKKSLSSCVTGVSCCNTALLLLLLLSLLLLSLLLLSLLLLSFLQKGS